MTDDYRERARTVRATEPGIDDIKPPDPFGQAAIGLCRRILRVGYDKALADELKKPTFDDPEWCRMIVALSAGKTITFEDGRTYRCPACRDRAVLLETDEHANVYAPACQCPEGQAVASGRDRERIKADLEVRKREIILARERQKLQAEAEKYGVDV